MNAVARLTCIAAIGLLGACASAPPVHHVTLDDGGPRITRSSATPSVAVVRANVPELIDRPQLVVRNNGHQVTLSEQYRWAEPLRREIPRVFANDLGELLESNRVAALPTAAESFYVDFKLSLDFQQLDAVSGQGTDVDVLWRIEVRGGKAIVGRSTFRQPQAAATTDLESLVATQRQALRRVATEIAREIGAHSKS